MKKNKEIWQKKKKNKVAPANHPGYIEENKQNTKTMNTQTTAKFAYPLAIEGSEEEQMALIPKLEALGYFMCNDFKRERDAIWLLSRFGGDHNVLGWNQSAEGQLIVNANNPNLVLALAAMREGNEFHVGEMAVVLQHNLNTDYIPERLVVINGIRENGHWIRSIDHNGKQNGWSSKFFRKATKEEIIAHYTKEKKTKDKKIGTAEKYWVSKGFETFNRTDGENYTNMKAETRKITGYKLIKEYPGSKMVNFVYTPPYPFCTSFFEPEFFQPIYEEEKPKTKEYNLPGVGAVVFDRMKRGITMDGDCFDPKELDQIFDWHFALRHNGLRLTSTYSVVPVTIKIGCKENVKMKDFKEMMQAYHKFINE